MTTIGAVLIVQDEEEDIAACLQSLNFCDEIIVVDGGSVDATCEIAQGFANVRLLVRPFDNFRSQRCFAISQSTCDWFLQIDADERVPEATAHELVEIAGTARKVDAFRFRFDFHVFGTVVRHGGYDTYEEVRFVRRAAYAGISERLVHEHLTLLDGAVVARAFGRLTHITYATHAECFAKSERYAAIEGIELRENLRPSGALYLLPFSVREVIGALLTPRNGRTTRAMLRPLKNQRPARVTRYLGPPLKFVWIYFLRRGCLDGRSGLYLAYMQARYIKRKYDFALAQ